MAAQPDYDYLLKIILAGKTDAGKTSLLLRYTENKFIVHPVATIGVDLGIKTVDIDGHRVKLRIWDTAGKEGLRFMKHYSRGAHGIVFVYDVNNSETFRTLREWISVINNLCPEDVSKIIVGNKDDRPDAKQVPSEDLRTLANEFGVPCVEVSAKLNVNVDNIFLTLVSNILKSGIVERDASTRAVNGTTITLGGGDGDEKNKCRL